MFLVWFFPSYETWNHLLQFLIYNIKILLSLIWNIMKTSQLLELTKVPLHKLTEIKFKPEFLYLKKAPNYNLTIIPFNETGN